LKIYKSSCEINSFIIYKKNKLLLRDRDELVSFTGEDETKFIEKLLYLVEENDLFIGGVEEGVQLLSLFCS